jgi:CPA2 family monovalent cation:H+ antiporter-2
MTTLNPVGAGQALAAGHATLRGDPTKAVVLLEAGVARARLVVVAEDEPEQAHRVVSAARALTRAPIVVRPRGDADLEGLADAGADAVVDRDRASAHALVHSVLSRLGHHKPNPGEEATVVDTTTVVRYPWPADSGCTHGAMSRPVLPRAWGCVDCLRQGTTWVHLRVCLTCGHVGCCDSSPYRHARVHAGEDGHPLIASAEPGEMWAYCFEDHVTVDAPGEARPARALPPA